MTARWTQLALIAAFSLMVAWAAPPTTAAEITGTWIEVSSPHFRVVTDAKPKKARKIAEHFEQIRRFMAQQIPAFETLEEPQLLIFAPSDDDSMDLLVPEMRGNRRNIAGFFRRTPLDKYVVIRSDYLGDDEFDVVYHEYFHLLADAAGMKLPTWANEGLADVWGAGTRLTPKEAEAGRPLYGRITELAGGALIPMEDLLTADRSSMLYRVHPKASQFYAQSWGLVHMFLYSDDSTELSRQFSAYLDAYGRGVDSLTAARQAFGDLDKLQRKLRGYARRPTYRYTRLPALEPLADDALETRPLDTAEISALLARYLSFGRSLDETAALVKTARAGAAKLPITGEAAGLLHARRREIDEGIEAFGAVSSALGQLGYATLSLRRDAADGELTREELIAAEEAVLSALAFDRDLAPAQAQLAEIYAHLDEAPQRALAIARRAAALEPEDPEYRLLEAQLRRQASDADTALEIVRTEVETATSTESVATNNNVCWHGSLRGFAREVMPACERAVDLSDGSPGVIDSRGLARALAGDLKGALADFRSAVADADLWSNDDASRALRKRWIEALERDETPFPQGDRDVIDDPTHRPTGWLG